MLRHKEERVLDAWKYEGENTGGKVGTAGFEPATPTSQAWCATRLRYVPSRDEESKGRRDCRPAKTTHNISKSARKVNVATAGGMRGTEKAMDRS